MKSQEERIAELCDEVKDLLIRKNNDYDNSFSKSFEEYGILSGKFRIDDKINRLNNLIKGAKDSVGESVEDTLIDLAGYALLTLAELRKSKGAVI
jgi:hypothetical protein